MSDVVEATELKNINYSLSEIHNSLTLLRFHCFLFGILNSAGIIAIIGTLRYWFWCRSGSGWNSVWRALR